MLLRSATCMESALERAPNCYVPCYADTRARVELICSRVLRTLFGPQPVSRMMGRATPRQRGAVPRAARDLRSTHSRVGGAPARPCPVPHGAHASSSSARVFAGHVELVSGHCCNDL